MISKIKTRASYLRNFIFGVEDSLVSTIGLLSGISIAGQSNSSILTTGIILIFVEAFSMSAGSFLSEKSAEEFEGENSAKLPIIDGVIMFVSYFIAGLIPLFPYKFLETGEAFKLSIILTLLALFVLGTIGGIYSKSFKSKIMRRGVRAVIIGGVAILVGVIVGQVMGV